MTEEEKKPSGANVNYYVLTGIIVFIVLFSIANSQEPQIDAQMDFFEMVLLLSSIAPGIVGYFVAKKYGGSKVFGKAYFSLSSAFIAVSIGQILYQYFQINGISNPFPSIPDIAYVCYYPLALYHLRKTIHYFKPKLSRGQKTLIVVFPITITSIYILALLVPVSVTGGVTDLMSNVITIGGSNYQIFPTNTASQTYQQITVNNVTYNLIPITSSDTSYQQIFDKKIVYNLVPIMLTNIKSSSMAEHDLTFWKGFFAGIYYVAATTLVFATAIVGFQVFRGSFLGMPWGLLLIGIGLISLADIAYYYTSIYVWDRTNPIIGLYVAGYVVACYALFKHRDLPRI